jgi:hypothetical protein
VTFTKDFDCWDRKKSIYEPEPSYNNWHTVYDYILDEELLEKTPLQERLLFKMGGSTLAPVLAHQSIGGLFRTPGVEIISVADEAEKSGLFDE